MPEDSENPQVDEDIVLKSNAFEIEYSKTSEVTKQNLVSGINIIAFDDVLALNENKIGGSAMELILFAQEKGVDLQFITYYEGGRWSDGVHCDGNTKDTCVGTDFELIPGTGYLIVSRENADLAIPRYDLQSPVPVAFSQGWNLVGVNGYSKAFTARQLIDSVNNIDGLNADNVSRWPTSKNRYEGLQVTDEQSYGLDFPISPSNGYFVRINEFEPSSSDCKSIIWHDGGDLNGTCGNSKTIF
jgi:hypothetical protein